VQTVTGWPTSTDATTPAATATVAGTTRDADAVSVTRELASALPSQILAGDGIVGASGSVDWSQADDVQTRSSTPWARAGGWPPPPDSPVTVTAGYGTAQAPLLVGKVDDTSGSFADGDLASQLIDHVDRFRVPFSMDPLLNAMPSETDGQPLRYNGLLSSYLTDRVARHCGYYATPPADARTVISAPMMGSMWPERGSLVAAVSNATGSAFPEWVTTPWGRAVKAVDATYAPSTSHGSTLLDDGTVELTVVLPAAPSGTVNVDVWWAPDGGNLSGFGLAVTDTTLAVNRLSPSAGQIASVARGAARVVTMRVWWTGSACQAEIRTDTGEADLSAPITAPGTVMGNPMHSVTITGPGSVGAVKVGFPTTAWADLPFTPTALFDLWPTSLNGLVCLPTIKDVASLEVLRSQADAECAAMWIDEQGRFRWMDRNVLPTRPTVRTLTSQDDLLDVEWVDDSAGVRSVVEVEYEEVVATRRWRPTVTVHQGRAETLLAGEEIEEVIHPPADEEWVMVDADAEYAGASTGGDERFNYGRGSWVGGYHVDSAGDPVVWFAPDTGTASLTQLDARSLLHFLRVDALAASGGAVITETNPASAGLWTRWDGQGLPLIRARAKAQFVPAKVTGSPVGPSTAVSMTHDAGRFIQTEASARVLADWLAAQTNMPTPYLRNVHVVPDARLELADTVIIDDTHRSGLRITGIVFGYTITTTGGSQTQSLTVRVRSVAQLNSTLGQYDLVWADSPLSDRDTEWDGASLSTFDTDPLRRT
jgi:hypothetical protein